MKTTVCEICKKATEDNLLTVGEHEAVCWDCATKMALDAKAEGREIEITDERGEACRLCTWCNELFPAAAEWRNAHGVRLKVRKTPSPADPFGPAGLFARGLIPR